MFNRLAVRGKGSEILANSRDLFNNIQKSLNNMDDIYSNEDAVQHIDLAGEQPEGSFPVYLKVYDLSHGLVKTISLPLLGFLLEGVWHTSIAIHGNEYFFGDGIKYNEESLCERITAHPLIRRIKLGYTFITKEVFDDYIKTLGTQFSKEAYNLTKWNCNNFSNTAAEFLIGKGIPEEYLTFIDKVRNSPHGETILRIIEEARKNSAFVVPGQDNAVV